MPSRGGLGTVHREGEAGEAGEDVLGPCSPRLKAPPGPRVALLYRGGHSAPKWQSQDLSQAEPFGSPVP